MIDYIDWLLSPATEDEDAEPMVLRPRFFHKLWKKRGHPVSPSAQTTEARISENTVAESPSFSLEESGEQGSSSSERAGLPPSSPALRDKQEESAALDPLSWESLFFPLSETQEGVAWFREENTRHPDWQSGEHQNATEWFSEGTRRARQLSAFLRSSPANTDGQRQEETSFSPVSPIDLSALDLSFQRDARRYDSGFSLL